MAPQAQADQALVHLMDFEGNYAFHCVIPMSLEDEETDLLNMLCQRFQSNQTILHFRKQTGSCSQLVLRQSFFKLISNFIKLVYVCTDENCFISCCMLISSLNT